MDDGVNRWPGGVRHGMSQAEHASWNALRYPGTRQLCSQCGEPTGRCEEDTIWSDDGDPLCADCDEQEAKVVSETSGVT